ncbi:uncharacterized protein M6B38_301845 [Iris pallida]|uniref:Uncharacterized protein n=1 Tax=Iris pallida TaxID=29817 RepID=A0AAX6HP53_IRIPA|nr:uncharacterized protein M6B38_301845 [Iris pallida]
MATDAFPVIDVRLLSQSDLLSLASSSPNSFDLRQLSDVVPTIDRSVFNESAGSRKQTYARHPLSPTSADPHPLPRRRGRPRLHPTPVPPPPPPPSDPSSEDNVRIVSHLRRLFGEKPEPAINDNALAAIVTAAEDRDREIRNAKGEVVDLAALAEKGDLYGEEMRRRTQGLTTAEQILGYMAGLDGEWGSRRRRRKTVDAAVFGDELPRGWKLLLWAKRKDGSVFLDCRRYVSPNGRQFMSCKEVSSYILSLLGKQDVRQPIPEESALIPSLVPMPPSSGTVVSNIVHDDPGRRENLHISSYPHQLSESRKKINESHSKKVDEVKERALALVEVGDREVRNGKGEVINLFRLAQKEDLFGEEIKRRTEELRTEEQVLGYMKGLEGQWGSSRKKRKIVDAGIFGDELPKGWKVLLGLKRKEGIVYLNCRSYVSPTGKQFMTCKEVSSYILSLIGHEDVRQPISGQHEASALHNPSLVPLQPSSGAAVNDTMCDSISRKENLDIRSYPHQLFESRETITGSHSKKVEEVKERASMLVEMGDRELRNGKGEVINLVRLAEKGDLFGEEIRRRTEELRTEEQVLGYMKGLDGQWGSTRKKRKIVDASIFADELPKGWKVLLGLKRKEGIVYLNCRRYVSPTGRQFMTCKEVSSYILSVIGNHVVRQPIPGQHEASAFLNPSLVPFPPSSIAAMNDTTPDGLSKENLHISSYSNFLESRESISKSHSKKVHEVEERAPPVFVEMKDREVRNAKGEAVDLVRLAEKGDLFREEIRRRTEELRTEEQLLGYMRGLEGQWGSSRKKRKIVDAGIFGDELPRGWKVLLGLKRQEGIVYLNCRSYFSPSGKQFMSCKEVSSYILSLTGGQDAQPIYCQYDESAPRADKLTSECVPGLIHQDGIGEELSKCALVTPISYNSAECEKHGMLDRVGKQGKAELENMLECRKCKMIFGDKDEQIHHMMTSHGRSAKRRKLGTFLGDVIIKNGTYECQFCHKTFSERHRYSGHIGAHVRHQSLHGGTPFHAITTGTGNSSSCWALVPYVPPETNMPANSKEGTCTAKSVGEVHVDSSHCRSVMENNETEHDPMLDEPEITESLSTTGRVVENSLKDCDMNGDKFKEFTEANDVTGVNSPSHRDVTIPSVTDLKDFTGKVVDNPIEDCDALAEKFKEFTEATDVKSPSCRDATVPFVVNVQDSARDSSAIVTQETSTSKSVDFLNDHELMSESAVAGESIVQRLDPNVCIDVIAPAVSNMDTASCETVTESVLPLSTSKTVGNSISGLVTNDHKSEDIVNTSNGENIGTSISKSDFVDGQSKDYDMTDYNSGVNTCCMSVEGNECYHSLSHSLANVEDTNFSNSGLTNTSSNAAISASGLTNTSSNAAISVPQDYNGGHKVEVENHFIAFSGNGSSYGVIDYTNGMFTSSVEEHGEIDAKANVKGDNGSHMLTSKDTDAMGTVHNDLNASYFIHSFSREQTCGIETTTDCMFPGDLNKSIFEEFDDVGNEVHNCFHSSNSVCEDAAAGDIISDDDGGLALQLNVANKSSSWLHSSNSLPILDMIPDQGEGGHGGLGPKTARENISGFDELRLGSMGPADFLLLTTQESGSQARSPIEFLPSGQLEWSLSLPNIASTVASTSVCVWCNREFISEDGAAEQQSGSLGYMCPECKARISGQYRGFP